MQCLQPAFFHGFQSIVPHVLYCSNPCVPCWWYLDMTLTKLSVIWLILKTLSSPPFKTQFYNACLPSMITENLIHGVCRKDVHATTELHRSYFFQNKLIEDLSLFQNWVFQPRNYSVFLNLFPLKNAPTTKLFTFRITSATTSFGSGPALDCWPQKSASSGSWLGRMAAALSHALGRRSALANPCA